MDTLGGRESARVEPANGLERRTLVGQPAAALAHVTAESDLDLLRPRVLIQLLSHDQKLELLAAAIGSPKNPFYAETQKRIYRDFDAEMADDHPAADLTDNRLRLTWLVRQIEEVQDERIIGAALGAWSYAMLDWPDDPYTSVHNVVNFLRQHEDDGDENGAAAALVLVEKALRRWLADAVDPDQAAVHLVIRSVDTNTAFPLVVEAGRIAGLPIDGVVARLRDVCRSQYPADGSQADADVEVKQLPRAVAEATADFDVSKHMASARTMSVLDQVLVRQAIASAVGMAHALTVQKLYALLGSTTWVVEQTRSWLHQLRRRRGPAEQRVIIYKALMHLACIIVTSYFV